MIRMVLAGAGILLLFPLSVSRSSFYGPREAPQTLFAFYPAPDWVYHLFPESAIPYGPQIKAVSRTFHMDPHLVAAVIAAESGFDPAAVSYRGAVGLMQVMPLTEPEWDRLLDPLYNLETGTAHLRYLLEFFDGDLAKSLAAYNGGVGRVQRAGRVPEKAEIRFFIRNVLDYYYRIWSGSPGPRFPINDRKKDQAGIAR